MAKPDSTVGGHVLVTPPRPKLGVRHLQGTLMALVSFAAYALRANLSVAIVAMVRHPNTTAANSVNNASVADGEPGKVTDSFVSREDATDGSMEFDWDEPVRGAVLSAFFWGYMLSQIPGGVLSQRLGGSRLLAAALMSTSVVTMLLPLCARYAGWKAVFANRVIQGITQGPVYPSVYTLLGVWVPPQERNLFTTAVLASQLLGPMLASPLCGVMAARLGWPSIFYTFGFAGIVLGGLLLCLGADRPAEHKRISTEELAYIDACLRADEAPRRLLRTPWLAICSTPCVWVLWVTLAVQAMVFFTFLTNIPTYLSAVLNFSLEENGILTSLPYLCGYSSSFMFTAAANFIRDRKLLSITNNRKLFTAIAHISISVCVVSTAYVQSAAMSVALICLSMGFFGCTFVASQANFLDLAPLHTGPLFSVGNMMAAVLGVLGPQIVGLIVTDVTNVAQWQIVFWGEAGILIIALVFYTWLGSGEEQSWNNPGYDKNRSLSIQEERSDQIRKDEFRQEKNEITQLDNVFVTKLESDVNFYKK